MEKGGKHLLRPTSNKVEKLSCATVKYLIGYQVALTFLGLVGLIKVWGQSRMIVRRSFPQELYGF